jgi:hypothetical protein
MTTIVYRRGVLAADTRATRNGTIMPERSRKVYRLRDGRLFAFCGDVGLGTRLFEHLNDPRKSAPVIGDNGGAVIAGPGGKLWRRYVDARLMLYPVGLRTLNASLQRDGQWQVSVQTDKHAPNSFSVAVNERLDLAIAELCGRCDPAPKVTPLLPPPPY